MSDPGERGTCRGLPLGEAGHGVRKPHAGDDPRVVRVWSAPRLEGGTTVAHPTRGPRRRADALGGGARGKPRRGDAPDPAARPRTRPEGRLIALPKAAHAGGLDGELATPFTTAEKTLPVTDRYGGNAREATRMCRSAASSTGCTSAHRAMDALSPLSPRRPPNALSPPQRKCTGIEPAEPYLSARPSEFEAQGRHQTSKHFQFATLREFVSHFKPFTSLLDLRLAPSKSVQRSPKPTTETTNEPLGCGASRNYSTTLGIGFPTLRGVLLQSLEWVSPSTGER